MSQIITAKRFPLDLLTQSVPERLAHFKDYTVAHARLQQVHESLLAAIHEPAGASLIFVFGAGAIGKTTLRQIIEKSLIEEASLELERDRGRLPVISFEVPPPDKFRFDWGDCYTEELQAGSEPLIDHKVDLDRRYEQLRTEGQFSKGHNGRVQDLRRALIKMLQHRRPAAVLVDEAQHLGRIRGANKLLDQLDCLKSLANQSGVVHVLLGSYELLAMRNLSAQLSWRSFDIHFSRYHANEKEDVKAFKGVLY